MRRARAGLALPVTVALVAGCAAGPVDLAPDASARLQSVVADVVADAGAGRYDAARRGLARVRAELARAADAGEVSLDRYRRVEAALARTETALAASLAADG